MKSRRLRWDGHKACGGYQAYMFGVWGGGIRVERNGFEGRNFDRCVKELLTLLF